MPAFAEKPQHVGPRTEAGSMRRPTATRSADRTEAGRSGVSSSRGGFDFNRIAIHPGNTGPIQKNPSVNRPGDQFEREADATATRVMNLPAPTVHPSTLAPAAGVGGRPLDAHIRAFMEPRFAFDFSRVRVHTDRDAIAMNRGLHSRAFTHHEHIFFGEGRSPGADALTAHELAHVVQQTTPTAAVGGSAPPGVQRVLEVQPPGPHDASAFGRRDELIARLNAQSPAIQYSLPGRDIQYSIIDAAGMTEFDRRMQRFIDLPETLPMRLTAASDRVLDDDGTFVPLMGDSFAEGNVDLDDLLADDDFSFRSDLVHFLTERASVNNYAKRVGSNLTDNEFHRGHRLGKDAEAAVLQDLFHDPSIRFNYEEKLPNNAWLNNFVSHDHRYQVFQVVAHSNREIAGGKMFVRTSDGKRVSMQDFKMQRDALRAAP